MRRTKILGLCLVAVLALGAMAVAGTAQAGEYGQCKELTKNTTPKAKHGKYEEKNCQKLFTKKGKPAAKGNFEWYPGPPANCIPLNKGEYTESACLTKSTKPHKGKFERQSCYPNCAKFTDTGGVAELVSPGGSLKCVSSRSSGEITGPKSGVDTITFEGCEALGGKCTGLEGAPPEGEIQTATLETSLIDHGEKGIGGKEPAPEEVWLQLANIHGKGAPYITAFHCTVAGFGRAKGSLAGVKRGIVNVSGGNHGPVEFEKGKGEQSLLSDLGCSSATFETCALKEAPSEQHQVNEDVYEAEVEIKT